MKKITFVCLTILSCFAVLLLGGELLVRLLKPQIYEYPRSEFSAEYGAVLYKNTPIVEAKPGRFKFFYTINQYGYRGKAVSISNRYDRKNIVVLGDSYSFGAGVNDGEEFSSIMQQALEPEYDVINLSVGGYGLTQEIRRFYEFGRLYEPRVVLLQFCVNDPSDNLFNRVTEIRNGRFVFVNTNNPVAWLKIYLSHSIIQKSQLYNFFRNLIYEYVNNQTIVDARIKNTGTIGLDSTRSTSAEQHFYNTLLEAFAADLHGKGIRLLMISVNGHLDRFPNIAREVKNLHNRGLLEYFDVAPWFEGVSNYESPEGHGWGSKAHKIVGQHLAIIVRR